MTRTRMTLLVLTAAAALVAVARRLMRDRGTVTVIEPIEPTAR